MAQAAPAWRLEGAADASHSSYTTAGQQTEMHEANLEKTHCQ
jgi:hypothetical protein